jgi:electron transfer flavoprotein alpha subunit
MAVLLIADVTDGQLATDSVAKALTAVASLGEVHVLVAGQGGDAAAAEAAGLSGVAKVLFAGDAAYSHGLAEPTAALVVGLAPGYTHICGASTAFAKNLLPRVAALLDVMVLPDVTAVVDAETFERPIYAGNAIQRVTSSDSVKVFTVRTASFEAAAQGGAAAVEPVTGGVAAGLSSWVEDRVAAPAIVPS